EPIADEARCPGARPGRTGRAGWAGWAAPRPIPRWAGRRRTAEARYHGRVGLVPSAARRAGRGRAHSTHPSGPHPAAVGPQESNHARGRGPRHAQAADPRPAGQGRRRRAPAPRLRGIASVRQGKRFELEIEGEVTDEVLASLRDAATTLLSNPVIEDVVSIDVEGSADGKAQA